MATALNTSTVIASNLNTLAANGVATAQAFSFPVNAETLPEPNYVTRQVTACKSTKILGSTEWALTSTLDWDEVVASGLNPEHRGLIALNQWFLKNQHLVQAWLVTDCDGNVYALINPSDSNTATSTNYKDYFAEGSVVSSLATAKDDAGCPYLLNIAITFPKGVILSQPIFNLNQFPALWIGQNWIF